MNIIELAKQAGIKDAHFHAPHPGVIAQLERFAAFVLADEREACAELMFRLDLYGEEGKAAEAIRARGNT